MSKYLNKTAAFPLLAILFLSAWFPISPAQISNDQDTVLTGVPIFLRAFYPELFGKNLDLNLRTTHPIDDSWRQIYGIRFDVYLYNPLSERMLNPPYDAKTGKQLSPLENPVLLEGLLSFNRDGSLQQTYVDGEVVHTKQNQAIQELIESHPEWSEDQEIHALKEAGAKYGPADKEQFIKSLHLEKAERFLGRAKILSVDFNSPSPDHEGNFAAGALDWAVHAEAELPDGAHVKYLLSFEPFDGKLVGIHRMG